MGLGEYSPGSKWYYAPNKGAPIAFIILFSISGVIHAYQTKKHKSWRFTIGLPWAALLMVSGFATRLYGAYHPDNLGSMIASICLIMSGPPVYALINYILLARLLYYIPYLSPIHPGRVATTFFAMDSICEALIGNGAWRAVNPNSTAKERHVGEQLVLASLIIQALLFSFFGVLAAQFHRRAARAGVLKRELRTVLIVLYTSALVITIRCIYRIVEYSLGWTSKVYRNEAYFWVFEASIMFFNTVLLNVWHPGKRLPKSNSVFLDRDGVTERMGPGWKDDRYILVSLFDPADVVGLVTGRDKKRMFWDMNDEELERLRMESKERQKTYVGKWFAKRKEKREEGTADRELGEMRGAGRRNKTGSTDTTTVMV